MQISFSRVHGNADIIIVPLFAESDPARVVRDKFKLELPKTAAADFKNKPGQTQIIHGLEEFRILLMGLGPKKDFGPDIWRVAIHASVAAIKNLGLAKAGLFLPDWPKEQLASYLELTGFALCFSAYRFDWYKKDRKKSDFEQIEIFFPASKAQTQALERGIIIGTAANNSRDLANHPGNIATPTHLANHAIELARNFGLKINVLGPKEIAKEKLGLVLGVARGSDEPPRFIVIEYMPRGRKQMSAKPIVLVGKGLTFDSGGISIKPADRMEEMKFDMAGGATVLGIIEAAARLGLATPLVGIIPSTENLVSGAALKPGDILTAHDQTSVEVINTDAEGRLILADGLSFAQKHYSPALMIDYATLTGAVIVALGDQYTGVFANTAKYNPLLLAAAQTTGEKVWSMPLPDSYKDQLKSQVADLKNVGEKGAGGAITAALFLAHFVKNQTPWIHLDIAGTAWTTGPKPYAAAGATGWGVYFTIDFLRKIK